MILILIVKLLFAIFFINFLIGLKFLKCEKINKSRITNVITNVFKWLITLTLILGLSL